MADGSVNSIYDAAQATPVQTVTSRRKPELLTSYNPSVSDAHFTKAPSVLPIDLLRAGSKLLDMLVVFAITWACLSFSGQMLLSTSVGQALPFLLVPVAALIGTHTAVAYNAIRHRSVLIHLFRVANGTGLALISLLICLWWIIGREHIGWPLIAAQLSWVALIALHAAYIIGVKTLTKSGRFSERVIIVGATPNATRLIARNSETQELNIVGVFDDRLARAPRELSGVPLLGRIDDLMSWERLPQIDRIIVTVTPDAKTRVRGLIERLRILPQQIVLLIDFEGFNPESESLAEIAHSPAAYVSGHPKDANRALKKRASDIIFASLLLVAFSPVIVIAAIAIRLDSKGPILFRQRRHGFNNEIIRVWKFRTMRPNKLAEERMDQQVLADDERVTRIGRILRKTSIDELPQLINVLRGEMSIVGPRPHAVGMTTEETAIHEIVGDYAHRHRVKPGITGWAQVNNSRGPVHTKIEVRNRVKLDMEYVNLASVWFDLQIMLMTAPCLFGDMSRDR